MSLTQLSKKYIFVVVVNDVKKYFLVTLDIFILKFSNISFEKFVVYVSVYVHISRPSWALQT